MTRSISALRLLPAIALLAAVPLAARAETFRCGSKIVSIYSTASEILQHCGDPTSKTVTKEPVRVKNGNGYMVTAGHKTTEELVYDRGKGAEPMVVIIVDGKVTSIKRKR